MLGWGESPHPHLLQYARMVLRDGHPAPGSALVRIGSPEHAEMLKRIAERPTTWDEVADVLAKYKEQFDAIEPLLKLSNLVEGLARRAEKTEDVEEYEQIQDAIIAGMEALRPWMPLIRDFVGVTKKITEVFVNQADLQEAQRELADEVWDEVVALGVDVTLIEHEMGIPAEGEADDR